MSKAEWAAVLLFLALALGIGLPYLQKTREISRRNTCDFRLVQLSQAVQRQQELSGSLPGFREEIQPPNNDPRAISWVFPLIPYLGLAPTPDELQEKKFDPARRGKYEPLAKKSLVQPPGKSPVSLPPLWCPDVRPDDARPARMHFVANTGLPDAPATEFFPADWPANGVLQDRIFKSHAKAKLAEPLTLTKIDEHDGTSTTLLFTENVDAGDWTDSDESQVGFVWLAKVVDGVVLRDAEVHGINSQRGLRSRGDSTWSMAFARPASFHVGGVNVVYCDGHSAFLDENLDYEIYLRIMTVDDTQLRLPGSDELFPVSIRLDPEFFQPAAASIDSKDSMHNE